MSKKFKGKLCVYCAQSISSVGEHVFAREFFLPEHRNNLPKVPSCPKCNGTKSELEHYLSTVLPFGGRHESAAKNLSTLVPKRLENNHRLHRTLDAESTTAWSNESGFYRPTMVLPFNSEALVALFAFIAKGLLWFHWQTYLTNDHFVEVIPLTKYGEKFFDEKFMCLTPRAQVTEDLGEGTFRYQGLQGMDVPQISVWKFSAFGGIVLGGDLNAPDEISTTVGVLTGPQSIRRNADLKVKFGVVT